MNQKCFFLYSKYLIIHAIGGISETKVHIQELDGF